MSTFDGSLALEAVLWHDDTDVAHAVRASLYRSQVRFVAARRLTQRIRALALTTSCAIVVSTADDPIDLVCQLRLASLSNSTIVVPPDTALNVRSLLRQVHAVTIAATDVTRANWAALLGKPPGDDPQQHAGALPLLWLSPTHRCAGFAGAMVKLSNHQYCILECLAARAGRAVPMPVLWTYVWAGRVPNRSADQVVRVVVSQLRAKLRHIGFPWRIVGVRDYGYVLESLPSRSHLPEPCCYVPVAARNGNAHPGRRN
jgi:DNA-binding response OmpR family regulator